VLEYAVYLSTPYGVARAAITLDLLEEALLEGKLKVEVIVVPVTATEGGWQPPCASWGYPAYGFRVQGVGVTSCLHDYAAVAGILVGECQTRCIPRPGALNPVSSMNPRLLLLILT
jgi:hypothetical protein